MGRQTSIRSGVPDRSQLLPVADAQNCPFCDSGDWQWVYLLLSPPPWLRELPWTMGHMQALCGPCHDDLEARDLASLRQRWESNRDKIVFDDFDTSVRVLVEAKSEPAIPRDLAQR